MTKNAHVWQTRRFQIWILTGISLALVLLFAFPTYTWMQHRNEEMSIRRHSRFSPVLMVPGSSATTQRFNQLISLLNSSTIEKHSVLKVEVGEDGTLNYSGQISKGDQEPFIIIGFQDNHDGYANIKKQAVWFDDAFSLLSDQYKFNNFKAFGHSNGGLILTYWLEHYYATYRDQIKIKRLMTVGTPYNFNEKSIADKTQMLEDFLKNKKKIPTNLSVYTVIGGQNYESDGIVPEESVAAGKYIYQKQVKTYMSMMVTGDDAQHSSLPQNRQVLQLIEQYLLDHPQQRHTDRP